MDLLEFLTSKEVIVVYAVAGIACLLCFVIYLVDKNNIKKLQRHNTRELNKLVEEIKEEVDVVEEQPVYEEPVLEVIEKPEEVVTVPVVTPERVEVPKVEEKHEEVELQYTSIEPDQKTAKLELKKLEEELRKQEEMLEEEVEEDNNISLTSYEEAQEENAIISLEELVKKSKDMYEANELTQYSDEGNEPITLQELEQRVGKEASKIEDTFIIENVVPEEELLEVEEEPVLQQVSMEDLNTVKVENTSSEDIKRFKSSPIISPIYGIEKEEVSSTDIELENTANYDKLDQEIKKTNEFLMTLRELQSKLD